MKHHRIIVASLLFASIIPSGAREVRPFTFKKSAVETLGGKVPQEDPVKAELPSQTIIRSIEFTAVDDDTLGAMYVGSLMRLKNNRFSSVTKEGVLLEPKKDGLPYTVTASDSPSTSIIQTYKRGTSANLVVANVSFSKDGALKYQVVQTSYYKPSVGLDDRQIKHLLETIKEKEGYYIITAQYNYSLLFEKFENKVSSGRGSYTGIVINGDIYTGSNVVEKRNFVRLSMIALEDYILPLERKDS